MAKGVELRKPKATVEMPLGEASPDNVVIEARVNEHPTFSFSAHAGKEAAQGITRVFDTEAAALMGRAQALNFQARTTPDTTVSMEDGKGGSLVLRGYLSGPTYFMSRNGKVAPGFRANAASSLVSGLRLDFYTSEPVEKGDTLSDGYKFQVDDVRGESLASRCKTLTEKIVKRWKDTGGGKGDSISSDLQNQKDEFNKQGPLPLWYKMLDASVDATGYKWLGSLADSATYNRGFNSDLLAVLTGVSRDFSNVIGSLLGNYLLVMVPDIKGEVSSFMKLQDTFYGEPEELQVNSRELHLDGASFGNSMPLQQVLMRGLPNTVYATGRGDGADKNRVVPGQIVGGFPARPLSASGDVDIIDTPPFMSQVLPEFVVQEGDVGKLPPDIDQLGRKRSQVVQKIVKFNNSVVRDLVEDYCRSYYVDRALAMSAANLTVPLDLTLWPGRRYRVSSEKGLLFEGFLQGVVHTLSVQPGSGDARSLLEFSHVLFPGFTLPGA